LAYPVGAGKRGVLIIQRMVIDMNEAQVRTLEQVRQVVAGTQALEFRAAQDDESRYAWIGQVLSRFGHRQLGRADNCRFLKPSSRARAASYQDVIGHPLTVAAVAS